MRHFPDSIERGKNRRSDEILDLVSLTRLMRMTRGKPEVSVGLIDGPVAVHRLGTDHGGIRAISPSQGRSLCQDEDESCGHGTFVAGILTGASESPGPAICNECSLIVRAIFNTPVGKHGEPPSASPAELVSAIFDCMNAGARILNLSVALAQPTTRNELDLQRALDEASRRGVIVVAAAGNQGTLGSTSITRHRWVIPVVASDMNGAPLVYSNLGASIGRRGLSAPGHEVVSTGVTGKPVVMSGTSAAAPFVTATIALLSSLFPQARAEHIRTAVTQRSAGRRLTVSPPLLDAWSAFKLLAAKERTSAFH